MQWANFAAIVPLDADTDASAQGDEQIGGGGDSLLPLNEGCMYGAARSLTWKVSSESGELVPITAEVSVHLNVTISVCR